MYPIDRRREVLYHIHTLPEFGLFFAYNHTVHLSSKIMGRSNIESSVAAVWFEYLIRRNCFLDHSTYRARQGAQTAGV